MKSRRRPETDFDEDFAMAMAKWKEAREAILHLNHGYIWEEHEASLLAQVKSAHRFMLSVQTSLRKLAQTRAELSQPQQ